MMVRALVALAFLCSSVAAFSAPCTNEQLVGTWSLVSIKADERGAQSFYKRTPYEVMRFSANGTFVYEASNKPYTALNADKRLDEMQQSEKATKGPVYTFAMSEEFLFIYSNTAIFQVFNCAIVETPDQDALPGDVLLTQFPGNPALRRVQRRL